MAGQHSPGLGRAWQPGPGEEQSSVRHLGTREPLTSPFTSSPFQFFMREHYIFSKIQVTTLFLEPRNRLAQLFFKN